MPKNKIKTKSSAKKRFHLTGSGKVKATQAGKRHNMRRRSQRMIRNARGTRIMEACDAKKVIKFYIPNN